MFYGVSEDGAVLDDPVAATQPLSKSVCCVVYLCMCGCVRACVCVGVLCVCPSVCGLCVLSGSCVFCVVSEEGAVSDAPVAATQPLSKYVCCVCLCVCLSSLVIVCSVV